MEMRRGRIAHLQSVTRNQDFPGGVPVIPDGPLVSGSSESNSEHGRPNGNQDKDNDVERLETWSGSACMLFQVAAREGRGRRTLAHLQQETSA